MSQLETELRPQLFETEWFATLIQQMLVASADKFNEHLESVESFHVGIVGPPNRGKSQFAWRITALAKSVGIPATYVDLDLWSPSELALKGEIAWEDRLKREEVSHNEVEQSIVDFVARKGLVIGDFPGRPHNPTQKDRLRELDYAVLLINDLSEGYPWLKQLWRNRIPFGWVKTEASVNVLETAQLPLHKISGLSRTRRDTHISIAYALDSLIDALMRVDDKEIVLDIFTPDEWRHIESYQQQFHLVAESFEISLSKDGKIELFGQPFLQALPYLLAQINFPRSRK